MVGCFRAANDEAVALLNDAKFMNTSAVGCAAQAASMLQINQNNRQNLKSKMLFMINTPQKKFTKSKTKIPFYDYRIYKGTICTYLLNYCHKETVRILYWMDQLIR
uniref:ATP-citrate synthase beta chain protein 1 n=1 Tax=Rhizophora mucronata TaxID=61149 RepID=A0A2P2MQ89_RHIMU